jgi:catechol 2,3-dioxygenase-like lactoylglutathione lyase family enzyme
MSRTDVSGASSPSTPEPETVDMALEVVTIPVADVERAKSFYQGLGWRLDADTVAGDDFRVVQFTPPHSQCSIHFGVGLTKAAPGSADRLFLAVSDIDAARNALINHGADVSEAFHFERRPGPTGSDVQTRVPGPDLDNERSYFTYASFSDPDGNIWFLQEIRTRLPGREWED